MSGAAGRALESTSTIGSPFGVYGPFTTAGSGGVDRLTGGKKSMPTAPTAWENVTVPAPGLTTKSAPSASRVPSAAVATTERGSTPRPDRVTDEPGVGVTSVCSAKLSVNLLVAIAW